MSILITGCAGFIGSHYTEYLINNDYDVIGCDNFDAFYSKSVKQNNMKNFIADPRFKFFNSDFINIFSNPKIINGDIEMIVHLAANAGVRPSMENPIKYIENNVLNTVKMLEKCRELDIENIVFASSSSVYGNGNILPYNEDMKLNQVVSNYAASKLSNELFNYVYSIQYGLDVTNLRFFTVYGPRQRPEMGIYKFFKKIINDEKIQIYGDGTSSRDYTYVTDIIEGINLSTKKMSGYQTFNLGNSNPITLNELIIKIENILRKNANVQYINEQMGDVKHTLADISKAKKVLNYNPKINMDEGLKLFYNWISKT